MDHAQWLEGLISRYSKALVQYVSGILKDREAAKEVVQDCFLKVIECKSPEDQGNIKAWLYLECRNRAIDIYRKRRRLQPLEPDFDNSSAFSTDGTDPLSRLETENSVRQLRAEVAKLSARHQEILWLKYRDGLSYKEIAEIMDLSATNVGFILYEATKALRGAESMMGASHFQQSSNEFTADTLDSPKASQTSGAETTRAANAPSETGKRRTIR